MITIGAPQRDQFYRYTWQGRDLPSWSTMRATAGMKAQIHAWALGGMADKAIELATVIASAQANGTDHAIAWARGRLWDAAAEAQGRDARRGTAVHEATHAGLTPEQCDPDVAPFVRQHAAAMASLGASVVASEFEVYNLTAGYGGAADRLLLMPDGGLWLVDLKTGRELWPEYVLQLMGYAMTEFVGRADQVDERTTGLLRAITGIALLHVRPEGWAFVGIKPDPGMWRAFRGLLDFASWCHDHQDLSAMTSSVVRGAA